VVALALLLGAAAVWMLGGDSKDAPTPVGVTVPAAREGAVGFANPALPAPDAAVIGEGVGPATAAPEPSLTARTIRGLTLRASDESPVGFATVIALRADAAGGADVPVAHARSDAQGRFSLEAIGVIDAFRAGAREPGRPDERVESAEAAPVSVQWANDDAGGETVRLLLDTGWRLDVFVVDRDGKARRGAIVMTGEQTARTDAQGRCAFLDLPATRDSIRVAVQPASGAESVSLAVPAPEPGRHRQETTLTVP